MDEDQIIEDAEVILEDDGTSTGVSAYDTQISLEKSIKMKISQIDRLREDMKPVRDMISSFLENEESYQKVTELAKEAGRKKSEVKKSLMDTTNGKELNAKLVAKKEEMKDAQDALTNYLTEYSALTGAKQIEGDDGEMRQIVFTAKLVRRTNLNRDL